MRRASAAAIAIALLLPAGCGGGGSSSSTTASGGGTESSAPRTQPANPAPSTVTTNPKPPPTTPTSSQPPVARQLAKPLTPTKAVKLALTAADPLVCRLYTPKLLERSFGGANGCRSAVTSGSRADSVEIVSSHAEGHHAVVVAVPHGGPSSAEKLTFLLALARGGWRLDAIKSNAPVGP